MSLATSSENTLRDVSLEDCAREHGLQRVGARPGLFDYARQVWRMRAFAYMLAASRIQARNQANRFGLAWLVITPLLDALIYGVVFGVLQGSKRPENFIQFLIIGIFFFRFFSGCLSAGTKTVTSNQSLVQSLSFPRIVLPLATAVEQFFDFVPMILLMLLISVVSGALPSWRWLLLVPVIGMATLFNAGLVMFMARLAVHFRDVTQLVPFSNRIMRYFSGVFYSPVALVGGHAILMTLFLFNPLYSYMEMARAALIPGYAVSFELCLIGVGWTVVGLVGGSLFFWEAEARYGRTN